MESPQSGGKELSVGPATAHNANDFNSGVHLPRSAAETALFPDSDDAGFTWFLTVFKH